MRWNTKWMAAISITALLALQGCSSTSDTTGHYSVGVAYGYPAWGYYGPGWGYPYPCCWDDDRPHRPDRPNRPDRPSIQPIEKPVTKPRPPSGPSIQPINRPKPPSNIGRPMPRPTPRPAMRAPRRR